jgi:hypothetical protein
MSIHAQAIPTQYERTSLQASKVMPPAATQTGWPLISIILKKTANSVKIVQFCSLKAKWRDVDLSLGRGKAE